MIAAPYIERKFNQEHFILNDYMIKISTEKIINFEKLFEYMINQLESSKKFDFSSVLIYKNYIILEIKSLNIPKSQSEYLKCIKNIRNILDRYEYQL